MKKAGLLEEINTFLAYSAITLEICIRITGYKNFSKKKCFALSTKM